MIKIIIVAFICVVSCNASGYGGGYGSSSYSSGPIIAAVQTKRTVEVVPVNLPQDPVQPQLIEVPSDELPVKFLFSSRSSPVYIQQKHIPGAPGQVEQTSSEEEPHRLVHEVVRPVVQEVREVIKPYRRVVQQIEPVVEQIKTVVAQGQQRYSGSSGAGGVIASGGAGLGRGLGSLSIGGASGGVVYSDSGSIGGSYKAAAAKAKAA